MFIMVSNKNKEHYFINVSHILYFSPELKGTYIQLSHGEYAVVPETTGEILQQLKEKEAYATTQ